MKYHYFLIVLSLLISSLNGCSNYNPFETDDETSSEPTITPDDDSTPPPPNTDVRGIPVDPVEDEFVGLDPISNLNAIIDQQNLLPYLKKGHKQGKRLKVAILDNGFAGLSHSKGKRLPPDVKTFAAPGNEMASTAHGTKMAEIVYAIATGSSAYSPQISGPEMLLLNTNGYTNLLHAIDTVINENVDIVLYAQVWEYGGNFDGKGFINKEVDRALEAGVLWVNAAGNLGQATWNGNVDINSNRYLELPYKLREDSSHSYLRFTVPQSNTPTKIVLAWNDFTDQKEYKTPQDLDIELLDEQGQLINSSTLVQTGLFRAGPQYSTHAREIIYENLNTGLYKLRIKAKSYNFDEQSMIRVTVNGMGIYMLEQTRIPTVLIPAENPNVLTVGATDVDYSGLTLEKPEIKLRSEVIFGLDQNYKGTSAATAIAVGTLAVYFNHFGPISKAAIDQKIIENPKFLSVELPD